MKRFKFYHRLSGLTLAVLIGLLPALYFAEGSGDSSRFTQLRKLIELRDWKAAETEIAGLARHNQGNSEFRKLRIRFHESRAREEYDRGNFDRATRLKQLADAVKYENIRRMIRAKRWAKAQAGLDALAKLHSGDSAFRLTQADLLINRAEESYQKGDFRSARKYYSDARAYWPNHPLVTSRLKDISATPKPKGEPVSVVKNRSVKRTSKQSKRRSRPIRKADNITDSNSRNPSSGDTIHIYIGGKKADAILDKIDGLLPAGKTSKGPSNQETDGSPARWIMLGILLALILLNAQIFFLLRARNKS